MASSHVMLPGTHRYARPGAEVISKTDPHEWVELTIKVRRQQQLPASSPTGEAVLDRATLAAQYGASTADLDKVEQVLTTYGIRTISKDPASRTVKVSGTAEAMEEAFNVHLFRSRHGEQVYRSRAGDIYVPQELDGIVQSIFGLDTRPMVKRHAAAAAPAAVRIPAPNRRPYFLP